MFKSKTPEFLEDTIFMKKRGESEDVISSTSQRPSRSIQPSSPKHSEVRLEKEAKESRDDTSNDFSRSVEEMLARKKNINTERQQLPLYNSQNNDLISIRTFLDHVKSSLSNYKTHVVTSEGKLVVTSFVVAELLAKAFITQA